MNLGPPLEQILQQSVQGGSNEFTGIEPGLAERLIEALQEQTQWQEISEQAAICVGI